MSLGLMVHVDGGKSGESRLTAALGSLMTGALLLAALEQFLAGSGARWWLPLCCALACGGWCAVSWRRSCGRSGQRLQALQDGHWRISTPDGHQGVDAVLVHGWYLGGLIWLHLRAANKVDPSEESVNGGESGWSHGSADCRFLLSRRSFDEVEWHALRRWLVWHRRSRRLELLAD